MSARDDKGGEDVRSGHSAALISRESIADRHTDPASAGCGAGGGDDVRQDWPDDTHKNDCRAWVGDNCTCGAAAITRDEFERAYAERGGMTPAELRALGLVVVPCCCDYDECEGWASVSQEAAKDYQRGGLYGPRS